MVGLELIRLARLFHPLTKIRFWRDPDGPEVDWLVETSDELIPIEAKWSEAPTSRHAKHLKTFLNEYAPKASRGYVVCRTPQAYAIDDQIQAIGWSHLNEVVF